MYTLTPLLYRWAAALIVFIVPLQGLRAQAPAQPTAGYGADGTFTATSTSFASTHPSGIGLNVTFYRPTQATGPVPTVFLSHGYGGFIPDAYIELMTHIVSRGYAVVFSPYPAFPTPTNAAIVEGFYDVLWAGFEEAVRRYPQFIDTTRLAFIGHSLGGGATPWVTYKAMVEKGWASQGAAFMPMAPWYSFRMTDAQFAALPGHLKAIVQIYADDATCDHRMGQDQYKALTTVPDSNKALLVVYADSNNGVTLRADHYVPNGTRTPLNLGITDALDFYAIYRIFDALADLAFANSAAARAECLSNGSAQQLFMGQWGNGTPVRPMALGTDALIATFRASQFSSRCDVPLNPRVDKCSQLTAVLPPATPADLRPTIGPNPLMANAATLHLAWAQATTTPLVLQVFDVTGRQLAHTILPAGLTDHPLHMSHWPAGLCWLRLATPDGTAQHSLPVLVAE